MKEIKKTIETIAGYEAIDGTIFTTKEECAKYEEGAKMVAYAAAKKHERARFITDRIINIFSYEDEMAAFDIPDEDALRAVNIWLKLRCPSGDLIDSKYIGQRVIIYFYEYEPKYWIMGNRDEFEKCILSDTHRLFQDVEAE